RSFRPNLMTDLRNEAELVFEIIVAAFGSETDGIVRGLNHQPIGVWVKFEKHFPNVFAHEGLGFIFCRTKVGAETSDTAWVGRSTVPLPRPQFGVLEGKLIYAI